MRRKPDAVLDGFEIQGLTNPKLVRGSAADRKNTRGILALLVGRDRCFSVFDFHRWPQRQSA
jgi:hypothetical protein